MYCLPIESYPEQVSGLYQEKLNDIKLDGDSLEGTISVSSDKILCVSIPYLKNWEAYLDGKPTELLRVNTAFMGVEVRAGSHTVRFVYQMKWLKLGIIMSAAGLVMVLVLLAYPLVKKKRQTNLTVPEG